MSSLLFQFTILLQHILTPHLLPQRSVKGEFDRRLTWMYLNSSRVSKQLVAQAFDLQTPLYFSYTHLVCRTALEGYTYAHTNTHTHQIISPGLSRQEVNVVVLHPFKIDVELSRWNLLPNYLIESIPAIVEAIFFPPPPPPCPLKGMK